MEMSRPASAPATDLEESLPAVEPANDMEESLPAISPLDHMEGNMPGIAPATELEESIAAIAPDDVEDSEPTQESASPAVTMGDVWERIGSRRSSASRFFDR